jgi:hypothetical protein
MTKARLLELLDRVDVVVVAIELVHDDWFFTTVKSAHVRSSLAAEPDRWSDDREYCADWNEEEDTLLIGYSRQLPGWAPPN